MRGTKRGDQDCFVSPETLARELAVVASLTGLPGEAKGNQFVRKLPNTSEFFYAVRRVIDDP